MQRSEIRGVHISNRLPRISLCCIQVPYFLPLPLGEGRGEGSSLSSAPHPNLLPEGEGTSGSQEETGLRADYLATPLALGSWWGLIPVILVPVILIPRILNEEQVLREELPGYPEYCAEVRWRLLPHVW